ncbi:Pili assembly chaperone N-terminal domain-containing protein [Sphingomonas antarctica]|uniref:fimbrial biogenesis chaperone n=1 Tax=Sphingomonas antarctica TaxID=2040274 RepID=UPI0039EC0557
MKRTGFLAAMAALLVGAPLSAMTVQPVVLDLKTAGQAMSQIITVENSFATPLPVEMRIAALDYDPDGLKAKADQKDADDLLVFPPQALIAPGQTQSFRVQYVGDPALAKSRHFYVTVAQLPVKLPSNQSAIQILYNFQVLVSVTPQGAVPALKIDSATIAKDTNGKPIPLLTLSDPSNAHAYLSAGRVRITASDAAGKEVYRRTFTGPEIQQTVGFGLVGAGQTRRLTIPAELPPTATTVDAQFTPEK